MEHEGFSDFIQMKSIMLCEGKLSIQQPNALVCLFVCLLQSLKGKGTQPVSQVSYFFICNVMRSADNRVVDTGIATWS